MPAPTALTKAAETPAVPEAPGQDLEATQDEEIIDASGVATDADIKGAPTEWQEKEEDTAMTVDVDEEGRPNFAPVKLSAEAHLQESRKVPIPPHRMTPLKKEWPKIYPPLVEHLLLQVRMNIKTRSVELRTSNKTTDTGALQKGEDFVHAFALGFDTDDAIAMLRLDDLYLETFEIKDVKDLHGEHKSRAIGRIAGKDGKMKYAIENASKTRIVLADEKIHILGGYRNLDSAKRAISALIMGSPPAKVYGNLRVHASRMKQRF